MDGLVYKIYISILCDYDVSFINETGPLAFFNQKKKKKIYEKSDFNIKSVLRTSSKFEKENHKLISNNWVWLDPDFTKTKYIKYILRLFY